MPGWLVRGSRILAVASALTYLVVSASPEFGPSAPFSTPPIVLYLGFVAGGIITGWQEGELRRGVASLASVVAIPALVFGTAMVLLPLTLGRAAFINLLILGALQRMAVYLLYGAVLGGIGLVGGLALAEFVFTRFRP
ncbi:MAG: hypothetical protein AB1445_12020 [Bacillota bacterium]